MTLALDHVQVAAPPGCEDDANAFYGELLGLAPIARPAGLAGSGGAWFALGGGSELHVGVEDPFRPATKAHPGLRAADADAYDALLARLATAGVAVEHDTRLDDRRRCYVDDPWGNRVELLVLRT